MTSVHIAKWVEGEGGAQVLASGLDNNCSRITPKNVTHWYNIRAMFTK